MGRFEVIRAAGRGCRVAGVLVVAAVALGLMMASSAAAKVIVDRVTGHKFGIAPPPQAPPLLNHARPLALAAIAAAGAPTCDSQNVDPSCASPMTYHGGPVQHGENIVLFFWDPSGFTAEPSYVTDMQNWVNDLSAGDYSTGHTAPAVGNPVSTNQQYYDTSGPGGARRFVPYAVHNSGTVVDTTPYPADGCTDSYTDFYTAGQPTVNLQHCFTAGQIYAEVHNYVVAHSLPVGINTEYFVMTPPNVGSCDDSSSTACAISDYCAWHTAFGSPSDLPGQLVLADIPWLAGTTCDVNRSLTLASGTTFPNLYTSGIDPVVTGFSHELSETMTDPDPGSGWFGSGGGSDENGDKCAYQYTVGNQFYDLTGLPQTATGAFYNSTLHGHDYLLQMEYDNRAGGCNQWDTDPQPTAAVSGPSQVVKGSPATFSMGNVNAPVGIAYVTWYFGDGATTTANSGGTVQHTYSSAGTRTVTAILTDNDGNEVKASKSVTVTNGGGLASLSVHVTPTHPAPKAAYTIKLAGKALPGGTFGAGHNRSDLELYFQFGRTCAATWRGEKSRAKAGKATDIGHWLVSAGSFSFAQHRRATPTRHATAHFCGYLSRSGTLTDAKGSGFYTTT